MNALTFISHLDDRCLVWVNSFMGRWPLLDQSARHLLGNHELKFGVMVAVFYWLWFRRQPPDQRERQILAATAIASLLGLIVTRLLVLMLPFRERPFLRPDLHFKLPPGFETELHTWSAFPSDHAVMAFALAMGFWMVSRPVGWLAFLHAALNVCSPRLYFGLHHPSDLVAGALIGVLFVLVLTREAVSRPIAKRVLYYEQRHRGVFYVCFFMLLQQTVVMFNSLRSIVAAILKLLGG